MSAFDIAIIGAGPAGMAAAQQAASYGAKILLIERDNWLGGQLVKQTHRFFGSKSEFAGTRGIAITRLLCDEIEKSDKITVLKDATALGYYDDGVLTISHDGKMLRVSPKVLIVATGAMEKMIPFRNNDLPGVYGAGGVQTLMNLFGVKPGHKVLMIGAGNIGLIVSYQLMQAGVEVSAVIEGMPTIGGYLVHASKIRRLGIPILTSHTITRAIGKEYVEGAEIVQIDKNWQPIAGTSRILDVDVICLAVGLAPLIEILGQATCQMKYCGALGGLVPLRDELLETTIEGVYVAGDAAGVEEATAAILEGQLAGCAAAQKLGFEVPAEDIGKVRKSLDALRSGPVCEHIVEGLAMVRR